MLTMRNFYAKPSAAALENLYYDPAPVLRFEPSYGADALQHRFKTKLKPAAVASAAADKVEKTLAKSQLQLEEELLGHSSKRKNQKNMASNEPKDKRKEADEEDNEYDGGQKLSNDKEYVEADETESEDKQESKNKTSSEGGKEEKEERKNSLAQTSFQHLMSKMRWSTFLSIIGVVVLVSCCCALFLRNRLVRCLQKCCCCFYKKNKEKTRSKQDLFDVEEGGYNPYRRKRFSSLDMMKFGGGKKKKKKAKLVDQGTQDSRSELLRSQQGTPEQQVGCKPCRRKKAKKKNIKKKQIR